MRNDDGYNGIIMGIFILIIVAVGAVGFLMISNEFNIQYTLITTPLTKVNLNLNNNILKNLKKRYQEFYKN
jgi:hypothetical protein